MTTRLDWMLILAMAVSAAACGDDDDSAAFDAAGIDAPAIPDAAATPDAPQPDAGPLNTAACPGTYGPAGVSTAFGVAAADIGFDLDGDDTIDNGIGTSDAVRSILSNEFEMSIANGSLLSLTELRDLDSLGADDAELAIVIYGGNDTDTDPKDNFTGNESFTYQHEWVRSIDCEPRAQVAGQLVGGVVSAAGGDISFFVDSLGGFLEIQNAHVQATVEADISGFKTVADVKALVGGIITGCSLASPAEGLPFGATSAQQTLLIVGVQPDVDVDGDGLETIEGGIGGIEKCIDGDGTEIPGEMCGCDPRMKDGYSVTFETDIVGAVIDGPEPI